MLGHRLARHVDVRAQLAQGLAVALVQPVEQPPACVFGQRRACLVHARGGPVVVS
ncbi:hypothetical protein [Streptomyces maremycinicus]|uniref:hypothetical protein n=1 Tax=Streptomyces maremycinicus TaxID=1679753 RepID=UPI001F4461C3|nr:hypothetical protein [Streptomyces sp. NBRC 110468]